MHRCKARPDYGFAFDPMAAPECPAKTRRRSGRRVFSLAATRIEPEGRVRFSYRVRYPARLGKHSRRGCRGAWTTVVRVMQGGKKAPAERSCAV
jgi:hypothetical protein